jgi:GWxTD domain-containing protein
MLFPKINLKVPVKKYFCCLAILLWPALESSARISASVDFLAFPGENGNGRIVFLFGTEGNSLSWKRNPDGKFYGRSGFVLSINDSTRNYFAERMDFNTPLLADSAGMNQTFSAWKVIDLPAGKYQVEMLVFDALSSDTSKERVSFTVDLKDARQEVQLSDLLFLEPSAFRKGMPVFEQSAAAVRNSPFFSRTDTLLRFYAEAHGLIQKMPSGAPLVSRFRILKQDSRESLDEFGRISRIKAGPNLAWITDLAIRNLPSGNYILSWDLIDTAGKFIARTSRNFQRSNPGMTPGLSSAEVLARAPDLASELLSLPAEDCRHLVASLFPLSNASDQPVIDYLRKKGTDQDQRNFLTEFWSKKDPQNALVSFRKFRQNVAEADRKYGTQTMKGYQTERGRVYIQYGKPDMVENEISDRFRKAMVNLNTVPYEIWFYYSMEEPVKQTDVQFVFVQQNRGNNNYKLLHSSGIGEVRNTDWRKAVENNATYNFDRLDPNDRNEISNPRQAR